MAFSFESAVGGANAGSQVGGGWGAAAGALLGGFFGGKNKLPKEQRDLYRLQMEIAQRLRGEANTPAMGLPQEQMAFANQRAQLGEEQRLGRENLYAAQSPLGMTNQADLMANVNANEIGQRVALQAQALQDSLNRRQGALYGASQVAGSALGPASAQREQGPDWGGMLGSVFQQLAYLKQIQRPGGGRGAPGMQGMGQPGMGMSPLQTPNMRPQGFQAPQMPGFGGSLNLGSQFQMPQPGLKPGSMQLQQPGASLYGRPLRGFGG